MYLALLAVAVALMLVSGRYFNSRINPASAFFATWILQLVLLAAPLYHFFDDRILWGEVFYIALALVTAAVGFMLGSGIVQGDEGRPVTAGTSVAITLGLAGIAGQLAVLYDTSVITGLSLQERMFGGVSELIRQMHFENQIEERFGPFVHVGNYLSPMSFLCLPLFFLAQPYFTKHTRLAQAVIAANLWLLTTNALFSQGGRIAIALAIGSVLVARHFYARDPQPRKRIRRVLAVAVVVIGGWYFGVNYLATRVGNVDPIQLMELAHRVEPQPAVKELIADNDALGFLLLSGSYFAIPTPTLIRYLHLEGKAAPGPYYGNYSFFIIARPITSLIHKRPPPFWEIRREVFDNLTAYSFAGNSWATGLRDLLVDFGRYGAITALFFLTVVSGFVCANGEKPSSHISTKALSVFLILGWLWFPFHMPTVVGLYFWPIFTLAVFAVCRLAYRAALESSGDLVLTGNSEVLSSSDRNPRPSAGEGNLA